MGQGFLSIVRQCSIVQAQHGSVEAYKRAEGAGRMLVKSQGRQQKGTGEYRRLHCSCY